MASSATPTSARAIVTRMSFSLKNARKPLESEAETRPDRPMSAIDFGAFESEREPDALTGEDIKVSHSKAASPNPLVPPVTVQESTLGDIGIFVSPAFSFAFAAITISASFSSCMISHSNSIIGPALPTEWALQMLSVASCGRSVSELGLVAVAATVLACSMRRLVFAPPIAPPSPHPLSLLIDDNSLNPTLRPLGFV